MRVTISNLGIIEQAEVDLKPLTIFIGPNNTGKTWVAYTLLAILGTYGLGEYKDFYVTGNTDEDIYPPLSTVLEQIKERGNSRIDLLDFADQYGQTYINNVADYASNWMAQFMGTERVSFDRLQVRINLEDVKSEFLEKVRGASIDSKLSVGQTPDSALVEAVKEPGESTLYLYTTTEGDVFTQLPSRAIRDFLARQVFRTLHQAIYSNVVAFPTERTAYITFPMIRLEDGQFEDIDTSQREAMGSLPWPIVLFFGDVIMRAFRSSRSVRAKDASHESAIRRYVELSQVLQTQILGGEVDFSTPEPKIGRELLFQPSERISLEMPIASSMVKELSSLALYLRYLAKPGELLVIDEPEMNLHPEAQVQVTEFLAMLANAGLNIIVTTHSPYLVDHLENLIRGASHRNKEGIEKKFFLRNKDAFIEKERVSVHQFGRGTVQNILDKQGMIEWDTFSNISDRVADIYFEL